MIELLFSFCLSFAAGKFAAHYSSCCLFVFSCYSICRMLYNIVLAIMLSVICPDVHKPSFCCLFVKQIYFSAFFVVLFCVRFCLYAAIVAVTLSYHIHTILFNYKLLIIIGLTTICWFCFVFVCYFLFCHSSS